MHYVMRTILSASLQRVRANLCRVISYVLRVAATFFNVHLAFVLYALTPLFFVTPTHVLREQC